MSNETAVESVESAVATDVADALAEAKAGLAEIEVQKEALATKQAELEELQTEAVKQSIIEVDKALADLESQVEAQKARKVELEASIGIVKKKPRRRSSGRGSRNGQAPLTEWVLTAVNEGNELVPDIVDSVVKAGYESAGDMKANVNQALHKLRTNGFVEAEQSEEDGRVKLYSLTKAGETALKNATKAE